MPAKGEGQDASAPPRSGTATPEVWERETSQDDPMIHAMKYDEKYHEISGATQQDNYALYIYYM